jgi:Domain of unknown function (DUF4260)
MTNPLTRPTTLLRMEGVALLAAGLVLYARLRGGWIPFALLILAPDLSMLGYLGGPRIGATTYNLVHVYVWPAAVGVVGLLLGSPTALSLALIWSSHISADRALGYGLKLPTAFNDTHLGRIGSRPMIRAPEDPS